MATLDTGQRVRIKAREQTEDDVKSQMYFGFYAGLTGTVQKYYSDAEVSVEVEHECLTKEIRKRHEDVRDQMKTKWIDGLSEEGRSKLTEREKDFYLRYVVLVMGSDLEKIAPKPEVKPVAVAASTPAVEAAPARKTIEEIEAAEAAELARRATAE
ncbi:MAG: hypothetical protein ABJA67_18330 [Chthonomonadales bacterium]